MHRFFNNIQPINLNKIPQNLFYILLDSFGVFLKDNWTAKYSLIVFEFLTGY